MIKKFQSTPLVMQGTVQKGIPKMITGVIRWESPIWNQTELDEVTNIAKAATLLLPKVSSIGAIVEHLSDRLSYVFPTREHSVSLGNCTVEYKPDNEEPSSGG